MLGWVSQSTARHATVMPMQRRRSLLAAVLDPSHSFLRGFGEEACIAEVSLRNGMRALVNIRLAISLLLLGTSAGFAEEAGPSPLEQRGRALAEQMCSQCHAVGRSGESPHASAPPFRRLDRRVDLTLSMERLREGLDGRPSRHADVSIYPRGCSRLRLVSEIYSGALTENEGCRGRGNDANRHGIPQ